MRWQAAQSAVRIRWIVIIPVFPPSDLMDLVDPIANQNENPSAKNRMPSLILVPKQEVEPYAMLHPEDILLWKVEPQPLRRPRENGANHMDQRPSPSSESFSGRWADPTTNGIAQPRDVEIRTLSGFELDRVIQASVKRRLGLLRVLLVGD